MKNEKINKPEPPELPPLPNAENMVKPTSKKGFSQAQVVTIGLGSGVLLGGVAGFAGNYHGDEPVAAIEEVPLKEILPSENLSSEIDDEAGSVANLVETPAWSDGQVDFAGQMDDDMSFSEAYATAREKIGAGGAFEWHGNVYSTYTAEEWNELSAEEKADFNEHFDWGKYTTDYQEEVDEVNVASGEEQNDVEVEVMSGSDVEAEVVEVTEDVDLNEDSEVEVLGIVQDEESGMNIGQIMVDGQEVALIDVDEGGGFEYIATDSNHDGQFTDDEILPYDGPEISVSEFEQMVSTSGEAQGDMDISNDLNEINTYDA